MRYRWMKQAAVRLLAISLVGSALPACGAWAQSEPVDECAQADSAWVFCSGFEEGDFSIWDDYDGNPAPSNVLLADPGPAGRPGNHVARLRVPPGRGTADLVKILPSFHDRLYARWYVMWEPGYDFSALNHGSGLHAGSQALVGRSGHRPDGSNWFTSWFEPSPRDGRPFMYTYYPGMYMDCADPNGACWGDHFPCMVDEGERYCTRPQHRERKTPPVLTAGRWYCVEVMLDGGTPSPDGAAADGVVNFWLDGEEYGPWDDLWMRTTPDLRIGILWLSLFHHGEHSVEGILLDEVVVSTEPIGCLENVPAAGASWGDAKARYRF
jgi:hypothetical protein